MKYKLKYVPGFNIRNTIDPDFGVIGSSKIYNYIPTGEIWLDELYRYEKHHFLKIHLAELKLMKIMTYEQARRIIEKRFVIKTDPKEIPNFIFKSKRYKEFIVKYVDGRIVRKFIDPKFILGCHYVLRRGAGRKEIWIDAMQDKREYKYSLLHEYAEAKLMSKGMNYNNAHDFALVEEKVARRKDGFGKYLKD